MSLTIKVVQPTGLLDGSKANQVRSQINNCLEAGAQIVLLDLKDVTFIDSSGLGSLVSALKTVRSSGAKMLICSISDQVRILFELTSMDRVFKVYANREEFEHELEQKSNSETSPVGNKTIDGKSSLEGKNLLEGRDREELEKDLKSNSETSHVGNKNKNTKKKVDGKSSEGKNLSEGRD